jgi:hypothetical protein
MNTNRVPKFFPKNHTQINNLFDKNKGLNQKILSE